MLQHTFVNQASTEPLHPLMDPTIWFYGEEIIDILCKWPSSKSLSPSYLSNLLKNITSNCISAGTFIQFVLYVR